ncbi:hypothetical protein ACFX2C_004596 [Malus domestica]
MKFGCVNVRVWVDLEAENRSLSNMLESRFHRWISGFLDDLLASGKLMLGQELLGMPWANHTNRWQNISSETLSCIPMIRPGMRGADFAKL